METKEFEFKGTKVSGFIGLLLLLACIAGIALTNIYLLSYSGIITPVLFLAIILISSLLSCFWQLFLSHADLSSWSPT